MGAFINTLICGTLNIMYMMQEPKHFFTNNKYIYLYYILYFLGMIYCIHSEIPALTNDNNNNPSLFSRKCMHLANTHEAPPPHPTSGTSLSLRPRMQSVLSPLCAVKATLHQSQYILHCNFNCIESQIK